LVSKNESAGFKEISWNGKDSSGNNVGSGFYFYSILAKNGSNIIFKKTNKMLLIK